MPIKRSMYLLLLLCLGAGCESFLDEKPNPQQVTPSTLNDFQALLDRSNIISESDPGAGEVSSDNYYLTDADFNRLDEADRRMYVWEKDDLFEEGSNDWYYTYRPVYTANNVLENIDRALRDASNQDRWDNVKGQALFVRARSFLQAAIIWAPAYKESTAAATLGIPLRLSTDFDAKSTRASLQETFHQIISDLKEAAALLPESQVHPIRPSKAAAYALLARTYLYMGLYPQAEAYADSTLRLHGGLLNFNTLQLSAAYPVPQGNGEIIFRSKLRLPDPISISRAKTNPELYESYAADDLRKAVFFRDNKNGTYSFKGSFEGSSSLFSGITTGEVYLMRAEAHARQGQTADAMQDLNTLLAARWKTGTFVPYAAAGKQEALQLILLERRKELLMRGLRWMDIKRLNAAGASIKLTRNVDGSTYTLPPNDPRYALPIPEDVIALTGMQQNPR